MSKNIAVIFAGGSGERMGSGLPKQFLEINGKPIIIHTLEIFDDHPEIDQIVIACKDECIDLLKKHIQRFQLQKIKAIVSGGETGQHSIYNALMAAKEYNDDDAIVLIHDGVRPFITRKLISQNIASVEKYGSAISCTSVVETPILSTDGLEVKQVIPRTQVYTAQAPQSFRLGEVIDAHERVRTENPSYSGIIDTCSLMKHLGKEVVLVKGNRGNIKVTTPEDLYLFRGLLNYRETEQSFGLSEDDVIAFTKHK